MPGELPSGCQHVGPPAGWQRQGGVVPAARLRQPQRQPGHGRQGLARAHEGHAVRRRGALGGQRLVGRPFAEDSGPPRAQRQRRPGHRGLPDRSSPAGPDGGKSTARRCPGPPGPGTPARCPGRGPAPPHRQVRQRRAEDVGPDVRFQRGAQGGHPLARRSAGTRRHEPGHRLLVRGLLLRPAGVHPRLAHVFQQRVPHPVTVRRSQPEHRLPGRPRQLGVRSAVTRAGHLGEDVGPPSGALGEHRQRGPHMALRLVSWVDTTVPVVGQSRCTRAQ